MKKLLGMLLVALILLAPATVLAASPWTTEPDYAAKSVAKFEFGFKNLLLGWTDIMREPGNSDNLARGIGKGVLDAILNTAGGAVHFLTFFIPVDVPLPDNGVQLT